MPWQLIYTSAPRGLLSGQSGFCTVAHSGDLREALAQRLEQISYYHYLRVAEAATANSNPTVCAFRILDLRGSKYHVLTRIQPCGLDFTARTNHLAHHLVFQGSELAQLPSPAAILRQWKGWLGSWQGEPRILPDPSLDDFGAAAKSWLPAQTWLRVTGDAGRAAGLLESECVRGCYLVCPAGGEQQVLEMFCETLQLLNLNGQYPLRPWRHPFTTFLQAEDNPSDFQWRACQEGTPAHLQAAQRAAAFIPLRAVRVPTNSLVKVAREGAKPPAPRASAVSSPSTQTLRREPQGKETPVEPLAESSAWEEHEEDAEESASRGINIVINWAAIARIGVVAVVLLGLFAMKYRHLKKHAAPAINAPVPLQKEAPAFNSRSPFHPTQEGPLDVSQLDFLFGDGPTYVLTAPNLINFSLPIDSISRFQNLIQRFDHLETRPGDIHLSLNTDEWDFRPGAPLIVQGRQTQTLSAQTASGLECAYDYANWESDGHNPVVVHTTFPTSPGALSLHFGFSSPEHGEPFRLLIVNESNPPVPLRLGRQWLRSGEENLAASFQAPLGERLLGNIILLGERPRWQLQPFVHAGTRQIRPLYKDWPAEDLPLPGGELNFAEVKKNLAARQKPLQNKAAGLAQKLEEQAKQSGVDIPLGKELGLTNPRLASFAVFTNDASTADFLQYLNRLKKQSGNKEWPRLLEDDDETQLNEKFQQIYNMWTEKLPGAKPALTIGTTNCFSIIWQNLKGMEKIRLEKQHVQDDINKLQTRLGMVPDALDKVAYVGLFIIDPPKPGLEMIRFEGP